MLGQKKALKYLLKILLYYSYGFDWCLTKGLRHGCLVHSGGEDLLLGILGGGVPPGSSNPDSISDQKMSFSKPLF